MGANSCGRFGDGTWTDRWTPVQVPGFTGVTAVAAGGMHSLFLDGCLPGDMDCDGDVDLGDYALFADCLTGPDVAYPTGCVYADLDSDENVDLADFAFLQALFAEPG